MKIEKELSEIRRVYAEADQQGKELMKKLYSKSVLGDITARVTTFETACTALGDPTEDELQTTTDEIAYQKLKIITAALNEGWKPDWSNENEYKYFPWFDFQGGRFVFSCVAYGFTFSHLGSRLCFKSRELAEYAGQQFEDLYNEFLK